MSVLTFVIVPACWLRFRFILTFQPTHPNAGEPAAMRPRRHGHKYHFNLGNKLLSTLITNNHEHREQEHRRILNLRVICSKFDVEPSVTPPTLRRMSNETRPSQLTPEPLPSLPLLERPALTPAPWSDLECSTVSHSPRNHSVLSGKGSEPLAPHRPPQPEPGTPVTFHPLRPALPRTRSFTVSEALDPYREFHSTTVIPHFSPLPAVPPKPPRTSPIQQTSPASCWSTLSLP